jgi:hypothetical protein
MGQLDSACTAPPRHLEVQLVVGVDVIHRAVAAHVDPFETRRLKPGDHWIGAGVETRRFQAMAQLLKASFETRFSLDRCKG